MVGDHRNLASRSLGQSGVPPIRRVPAWRTDVAESSAQPVATAIRTVTPHLVVRDAARAADWYRQAPGAQERSRVPLPNGKLMSVELRFGDSPVMIADEFPEFGILSPLSIGGTATVLNISTSDVDALWRCAIDAGADVHHPLQDAFWGDRHGQITDPFGHRWGLAQHIRDVSPDEMRRGAAAAFGG